MKHYPGLYNPIKIQVEPVIVEPVIVSRLHKLSEQSRKLSHNDSLLSERENNCQAKIET